MKKIFLLLMIVVATVTLNAQVFTEYFENATVGTDLELYNDWYVSAKSSEANGVSPIFDEFPLFYTGYAGSDLGKSVILDSLIGQESSTQRISTRIVHFGTDTLQAEPGKTMYAAFMVSILPDSWDSYRDFFTWEGSTTSSFTRGRVFAKLTNEGQDLTFAISKNSSSGGDLDLAATTITGGVNGYNLLVLAYTGVEGDANDVVSLYVNPDPTKTEAEQTAPLVNVDTQSDYGSNQIKINLRQRGIGAVISGIRVGTDWAQVVQGGAVTGVTLDKATSSLLPGEMDTVYATVAPDYASNPIVTWSSDAEAVATVVNGIITAVSPGVANITATSVDGSLTASCEVTVSPGVGFKDMDTKGFSMYPNPVTEGILYLNLSENNKASNIEIYNVLGVLIHNEKVNGRTQVQLNTSAMLTKGVYFVKVKNTANSHIEQLVVK